MDLTPTLLELCGLDANLVGGRSYAPLVARDIDTKRRNHILFDAGGGNLGVRLGAKRGRGPGEQFRLGDDLSVYLETDDDFPVAGLAS